MDEFSDIRPYNDEEVPGVLARLLNDPELLAAICRLRFKGWATWLGLPLRWLVKRALKRELRGVNDVAALQGIIEGYMSRMIEDTTSGFSVSGLDNLTEGGPYLFMSNHRDITLDPAFTNYALFHNGFDTVRIAIGDNLLTKPYVSDLMRLNKSFIVRRSAKGPREMLKAYKTLSAYIRHSIQVDKANIWIAQREGRAKDGIDRTEPAIIKMLSMSLDRKTESFSDFIRALRIVPVSISYELDPCDALKAAELEERQRTGQYQKSEHEDVASIAAGISGNKGLVHVAFGRPLSDDYDNPEQVAAALDQQIIANYQLHATNAYAWRMLHGEDAPMDVAQVSARCKQPQFEERIAALPVAHRPHALAIYANAIASKLILKAEPATPIAD